MHLGVDNETLDRWILTIFSLDVCAPSVEAA